ncbi:MAG: AraC family transcriptional regulator [Bacteroidota bacterium]
MIFESHQLEGRIKDYIEAIFHYKDFEPDHSIERVVPTGHIYIVFELDGFTRYTYDKETLEPNNTYTKVWVSGMHKDYISISAHQKSEMFVIQFKPYGAYPFFHFPIHELNEKIVPACDILGEDILILREEILKKSTPQEKFMVAEDWLNRVFNQAKVPPLEILDMIEKLGEESVGSYKGIVENYSKTQKHLIDQFKKYVGLTPKYYQRILRFNEILHQIHKSKKIEWSQVAYQFEYADQSHFIKEFKHFSGINPQEFIKHDFHNGEGKNFFPLDRQG